MANNENLSIKRRYCICTTCFPLRCGQVMCIWWNKDCMI